MHGRRTNAADLSFNAVDYLFHVIRNTIHVRSEIDFNDNWWHIKIQKVICRNAKSMDDIKYSKDTDISSSELMAA